MSRKTQLPLVSIPKEVYPYIPPKEIQTNFPFIPDRVSPIADIYPNRVTGGHLAIVEFHLHIKQ
jgi:hypothetical protein